MRRSDCSGYKLGCIVPVLLHLFATHASRTYGEMGSMDPDEQPDDDPGRPPRAPFVPSEAWIEAFDAQCTERMLTVLRRYAASWARFVGGDTGSDYAEDLVQIALTDTLRGLIRWNPGTAELEPFLISVIRLRARRDRKIAARYEHVFIDALDPDDAAFADFEASLAAGIGGAEQTDPLTMDRTIAALLALLPADPHAQRFLDAVRQGATTKPQIMRLGALTDSEFRNARRRLGRLLAQLTSGRAPSTEEGES